MKRFVPHLLAGLCGLWILSLVARAPFGDDPGLGAFARLPVSFEGRLKPMDTVARNALLGIQGKSTFKVEGQTLPAARWLLDAIARPAAASDYAVFRVDHPDVLGLLGRRQESSRTFLSANDLREHQAALFQEAQKISQLDPKERDGYQTKLLELAVKLNLFDRLSSLRELHVVPPLAGEPDWLVLDAAVRQGQASPSAQAAAGYGAMLEAWHDVDAARFQSEAEAYAAVLADAEPEATAKAALETRFNAVAPFYRSMLLYVLAFVLCLISWLCPPQAKDEPGWGQALLRAAVWVALVSLVVHTVGLAVRVHLMDRPPVTNLYSSAVFVGWGAVIVALLLEQVFENGVGTLTAALIGSASLLVAQGLAADGTDTMAVLQAVLDTNFWLATHVVVITLGYAATFLAGFLGLVFVLKGMATRSLDRAGARHLVQMIYGVVCFATLFSFVGTILGGIWADQSWGRFWGWDPKENGALLIVLWNAVILHARWGGMVRQRGIAVLAILGNVVTAWSWFGTNMMGVGLHSYGFMEQAAFWLVAFVLGNMAVAAAASFTPLTAWRSDFQAPQGPAPAKAEAKPAAAKPAPAPDAPAPDAPAPDAPAVTAESEAPQVVATEPQASPPAEDAGEKPAPAAEV